MKTRAHDTLQLDDLQYAQKSHKMRSKMEENKNTTNLTSAHIFMLSKESQQNDFSERSLGDRLVLEDIFHLLDGDQLPDLIVERRADNAVRALTEMLFQRVSILNLRKHKESTNEKHSCKVQAAK
jgi:hypothetical protein